MKRNLGIGFLVLVAAAAVLLTCALAQVPAPTIVGTVTMYDGRTFTGAIQQAAFGIYEGVGIEKSTDGGRGSFILDVDGEERTIDALEVAKVEVAWQEPADADTKWSIDTITVTTKDGEVVQGKPTWRLAASLLEIAGTEDAAPVRITAYPISATTFSSKNLVVKIEIAGAEAPPGGEVTPPGGEVTPPGGEVTPPGGEVTPPAPAGVGEPVAVTLTLTCPKCKEPITVQIDAHAR